MPKKPAPKVIDLPEASRKKLQRYLKLQGEYDELKAQLDKISAEQEDIKA